MALRFDFKKFYEEPNEEGYFQFRHFLKTATEAELKAFSTEINRIPSNNPSDTQLLVLSTAHEMGKGVKSSPTKARQHLQKIKERENDFHYSIVLYLQGQIYLLESSLLDDEYDRKAKKCFFDAAQRGCKGAYNSYGEVCEFLAAASNDSHDSIAAREKEWSEAFTAYQHAASYGSATALVNQALLYIRNGDKVPELKAIAPKDLIIKGVKKLVSAHKKGHPKIAEIIVKLHQQNPQLPEILRISAMGTKDPVLLNLFARQQPHHFFHFIRVQNSKEKENIWRSLNKDLARTLRQYQPHQPWETREPGVARSPLPQCISVGEG